MNRRQLELICTTPAGSASTVSVVLSADRPSFVVGSGAQADLSLREPPMGERQFRISLVRGAVEVACLDQGYPMSCNGRPLMATTPLNNRDRIEVGDLTLIVSLTDPDAAPSVDAMQTQDFIDPPAPAPAPSAGPFRSPTPAPAAPSRGATPPISQTPSPTPSPAPAASPSRGVGSHGPATPFCGGLSAPGASDANLPFVERAMRDLVRDYPERAGRRTRRELQALIERGRERAKSYGFETDEQAMKFLHCVMLLDNELSRATNPDVAYVIDTLTVPNKPADKRIDRALTVARKLALGKAASPSPAWGAQPVGQSPAPAPQSPAPAAKGPARAATPPPQSPSPQAAPRRVPPAARKSPPVASAAETEAQTTHATPPPPVEELQIKAVSGFPEIEGFRILEQIASGGMGTVYLAQDLQLDIEVAIKVLRSMHPAAQQQFLMEARAAARLQHPNIVPVLRYERYGQGGYCVMQLIRGKDAHNLVKSFGDKVAHTLDARRIFELAGLEASSLNPDVRGVAKTSKPYYRLIAHWISGVADGLDRAHAEGIIHYDVKPSNLMLAGDGRMMLGDFGLATLGDKQLLSNNACIGTPAYLAPEMLAAWASRGGASETDLRVDIWGLGLALYELLTYRPAFDGTLARVLRSIATIDPAPPKDVVWQVPDELQRICAKAIARNPDERYARAAEMADDLRNWLAGKSEGETPAGGKSGWLWGRKGKGE